MCDTDRANTGFPQRGVERADNLGAQALEFKTNSRVSSTHNGCFFIHGDELGLGGEKWAHGFLPSCMQELGSKIGLADVQLGDQFCQDAIHVPQIGTHR